MTIPAETQQPHDNENLTGSSEPVGKALDATEGVTTGDVQPEQPATDGSDNPNNKDSDNSGLEDDSNTIRGRNRTGRIVGAGVVLTGIAFLGGLLATKGSDEPARPAEVLTATTGIEDEDPGVFSQVESQNPEVFEPGSIDITAPFAGETITIERADGVEIVVPASLPDPNTVSANEWFRHFSALYTAYISTLDERALTPLSTNPDVLEHFRRQAELTRNDGVISGESGDVRMDSAFDRFMTLLATTPDFSATWVPQTANYDLYGLQLRGEFSLIRFTTLEEEDQQGEPWQRPHDLGKNFFNQDEALVYLPENFNVVVDFTKPEEHITAANTGWVSSVSQPS